MPEDTVKLLSREESETFLTLLYHVKWPEGEGNPFYYRTYGYSLTPSADDPNQTRETLVHSAEDESLALAHYEATLV